MTNTQKAFAKLLRLKKLFLFLVLEDVANVQVEYDIPDVEILMNFLDSYHIKVYNTFDEAEENNENLMVSFKKRKEYLENELIKILKEKILIIAKGNNNKIKSSEIFQLMDLNDLDDSQFEDLVDYIKSNNISVIDEGDNKNHLQLDLNSCKTSPYIFLHYVKKNAQSYDVYKRGVKYFNSIPSNVIGIRFSNNILKAVVEGEHKYNVEVSFEDDVITDYHCSCPAHRKKGFCKHVVAALIMMDSSHAEFSSDFEKTEGTKQHQINEDDDSDCWDLDGPTINTDWQNNEEYIDDMSCKEDPDEYISSYNEFDPEEDNDMDWGYRDDKDYSE